MIVFNLIALGLGIVNPWSNSRSHQQIQLDPAVEILIPTPRSHKIQARCAGGSAELAWKFDGKAVTFHLFRFNGKVVSSDDLAQINRWSSDISGDVFAWIECDSSAAIVKLIQAQLAGTPRAKQIKFQLVSGRVSFVKKYNF